MGIELALNDLALLALVHEFDRIFQADDVQPPGLIQMIDHRCERGGFPGPGRAGH